METSDVKGEAWVHPRKIHEFDISAMNPGIHPGELKQMGVPPVII